MASSSTIHGEKLSWTLIVILGLHTVFGSEKKLPFDIPRIPYITFHICDPGSQS